MKTKFTVGGITYSLISSRPSRRDIEAAANNIQPDTTLWTSAQREAAMHHRTEATPKEIHAAGARGST